MIDTSLEDHEGEFARWWEKTVEYVFVLKFSKQPFNPARLSPLAGKLEEYFGDLIVKDEGSFRLIEFKRNRKSVRNEHRKYHGPEGFSAALKILREMPGSAGHHIVYAEEVSGILELWAVPYCDNLTESGKKLISIDELKTFKPSEFADYAAELMQLRGGSPTSVSGGAFLVSVGSSVEPTFVSMEDAFLIFEKIFKLDLAKKLAKNSTSQLKM